MGTLSTHQETQSRVVARLKSLAAQAEELCESLTGDATKKGQALRKTALKEGRVLRRKASAGIKLTDKTVHSRPYESIGIAFVVGMAIGAFCLRK